MAVRGALYRCHLFSFGGPQTEGVDSFWARNLNPIGEEVVNSGEWVELFAIIKQSQLALTEQSRIRFDILEEDFLIGGGADDRIALIRGTGAKPSEEEFPKVIEKTTVFIQLAGGYTPQDAARRFKCEKPDGYRDYILIMQDLHDEPVWYVLTWWQTVYDPEVGKDEFYFIINVDEAFEDTSNVVLYVREEQGATTTDGQVSFSLASGCELPKLAIARRVPTTALPISPEERKPEQPPSVGSLKAWVGRAHEKNANNPANFLAPPDATSPFGATDEEAVELESEDYVTAQCKMNPWPEFYLPHPNKPEASDVVKDGTSPYDDMLIAWFPPHIYVKTKAHRYAISYNIVRALQWGWLLFGTRSFVIVEGPLTKDANGVRDVAYHTIPVDNAIELRERKTESAKARVRKGGRNLFGIPVKAWITEYPGPDRRPAALRVMGTANQFELIIPFLSWAFYCEFEREIMMLQSSEDTTMLEIDKTRAKREAFSRVERARKANKDQEAANELTYLGRAAFALLGPKEREDYIILLIDAWTHEAQERSIVEIFRSVADYEEFTKLVQILKDKQKFQKLIDDLDYKLWDLLQTIGTRFGDKTTVEMNREFFLNLLIEAGQVAGAPFMDGIAKIQVKHENGRLTVTLKPELFSQLREAGQALLRFLITNIEGIWMMLSQPDKLIEGIEQLIKLGVMLELSKPIYSYPPAQQFVAALSASIKKQIVATYKGMLLLGAGEEVTRRVRWMLLVEIASMFIGVGEMRAALEAASGALRLGERLAGLGRIANVFRKIGQVEEVTLRMERLAVLMANEGRLFRESEEAIRLLSALPPEDLTLLERALEKAKLDEVPNAAVLAKASPDVAKAMEHIEPRLHALQAIERKMLC